MASNHSIPASNMTLLPFNRIGMKQNTVHNTTTARKFSYTGSGHQTSPATIIELWNLLRN